MKQTAVNKLINNLLPYIDRSKISDQMLHDILENAIYEEKEQIINAYIEASENFDDIIKEIAEHFYKETYEK